MPLPAVAAVHGAVGILHQLMGDGAQHRVAAAVWCKQHSLSKMVLSLTRHQTRSDTVVCPAGAMCLMLWVLWCGHVGVVPPVRRLLPGHRCC
jgi:hypothetical protein